MKANKDGWIRHRGGKCPVEAGTLVDVRTRYDGEFFGVGAITGWAEDWSHTGDGGDIMAWRPHNAVEQRIIEAEQSALAAKANAEAEMPAAKYFDGPLQWRDRIHAIDFDKAAAQKTHETAMAALDSERADLVAKLKAEGLMLVQAEEDSQQEDMSDWRNWKPGDLVEIIDPENSGLKKGERYPILQMDFEENEEEDGMFMPCLLEGSNVWLWMKNMKWHSRPSN